MHLVGRFDTIAKHPTGYATPNVHLLVLGKFKPLNAKTI
jgi:hypothetical protein